MERDQGRLGGGALFWLVLLLAAAWRVWVAGRLDLVYDEGYYHYWSVFPSWIYYDHPPLIAWAMFLSGRVLGESVWSVRIWPLLGGLALALLGRELGRRTYGRAAGNRAGIFLALAPVFLGNGFLMTPDALLAPAWAGALLCTWNALRGEGRNWGWWVAAGVVVGLGLLAKYTMILYFFGLGLLWLRGSGARSRIFWGGALAGVVALVLFTPVLYWNWLVDWEPFRFQLHHGFEGKGKQYQTLVTLGEYLGSLLALATPLLGGAALWFGFKGALGKELRERFLGLFLVAVVLFFGYSALKARVQGNWPMVAFVSGLVLVGGKWATLGRLRAWSVGLLLAVVGVGGGYLLLPRDFGLRVGGYQLDPQRYREFVTGPEMAEAVRGRFEESRAELIGTTSHQIFGRISFYAPELRDRLWLLTDKARMRFPWIEDREWRGAQALIVEFKDRDDPGNGRFERVGMVGRESFVFKGDLSSELVFWLGEGYTP